MFVPNINVDIICSIAPNCLGFVVKDQNIKKYNELIVSSYYYLGEISFDNVLYNMMRIGFKSERPTLFKIFNVVSDRDGDSNKVVHLICLKHVNFHIDIYTLNFVRFMEEMEMIDSRKESVRYEKIVPIVIFKNMV